MHLERKIRRPISLEAAQSEFKEWCESHGYEILGHLHSFWQQNMFTMQDDALVEASVRRTK